MSADWAGLGVAALAFIAFITPILLVLLFEDRSRR